MPEKSVWLEVWPRGLRGFDFNSAWGRERERARVAAGGAGEAAWWDEQGNADCKREEQRQTRVHVTCHMQRERMSTCRRNDERQRIARLYGKIVKLNGH